MKLPDAVWQVVKDHLLRYKGFEAPDELRGALEKHTNIELFDGGAFIAVGNEFDLFVVPEKGAVGASVLSLVTTLTEWGVSTVKLLHGSMSGTPPHFDWRGTLGFTK